MFLVSQLYCMVCQGWKQAPFSWLNCWLFCCQIKCKGNIMWQVSLICLDSLHLTLAKRLDAIYASKILLYCTGHLQQQLFLSALLHHFLHTFLQGVEPNLNRKPYQNCNSGRSWTQTQTDILETCLNPNWTWTEKIIIQIQCTSKNLCEVKDLIKCYKLDISLLCLRHKGNTRAHVLLCTRAMQCDTRGDYLKELVGVGLIKVYARLWHNA